MVWDFENLRISMAQQSYNFVQQLNDYGRSEAATKDNDILDYHRDRIRAANSELELMVTEGRYALETANPVLAMAQLRIDKAQVQAEKEHERTQRKAEKAQEGRQRRMETLLAVVGVALGLPHLLEPETTAALLGLVGIDVLHTETGLTESGHLIVTETGLTESGHLIVLVAQVTIIALVAGLLVWRYYKSR